jgi:hypothetical protein
MLFVEVATGTPKTKVQLQQENKNMSLPRSWTAATMEALGVTTVAKTAKPTPGEFEMVVADGVEQVNGVWQEKWIVQDMFTEYTDSEGNTVTVQAQKDAKTASDNAAVEAAERATRDALLKATDHFALSDVTMSAEMTTYRQALRDVPQQSGFPSTITWPTKPE